jgi:hypothetical protein
MPAIRANWYNLNATRRYPLDDRATGTDDDGVRLVDDILVDCRIRFPGNIAQHAFIGGLTVTDTLVTIVFLGSMTPSSTKGRFIPLGSVTVVKPGDEGVHYPIAPLYPGVGGFVAFGDISEVFSARFSTPTQSLLLPRCARGYNPLPVLELRKAGLGVGLTGLITIVGEDDVEVVKEKIIVTDPVITTQYKEVDALVIRLRQDVGGANVLEKYIGPCGQRPESGNCKRPGIEFINDAQPDCRGNINFDFQNMAVGSLSSCGGFTLDTSVGMNDACREFVPDRFQGEDQCPVPRSSSSSSSSSSSLSLPSSLSSASVSESVGPGPPPVDTDPCYTGAGTCTAFEDPEREKYMFWDPIAAGGLWENAKDFPAEIAFEDNGNSFQSCESEPPRSQEFSMVVAGARTVYLFRSCSLPPPVSWGRTITADMRFGGGPCGLVLGWHLFGTGLQQNASYYMAMLNPEAKKLEIWWYPGKSPPVKVGERSFAPARIRFDRWYRWEAVITKLADDPFPQALINVTLTSLKVTELSRVSYSFATRRWDKLAQHGFGAYGGSGVVSWADIY